MSTATDVMKQSGKVLLALALVRLGIKLLQRLELLFDRDEPDFAPEELQAIEADMQAAGDRLEAALQRAEAEGR